MNFAYYPIISDSHPFFMKLTLLVAQYGDIDRIPDKAFPNVDNFTVLIKTERFDTVGSIPKDWKEEKSVTGLVINKIKKLDGKERELMNQSFPKVDLDKVLILEEGRTPTSSVAALGMIVGGVVLIIAGLLMLVGAGKKQEYAPVGGDRRAI